MAPLSSFQLELLKRYANNLDGERPLEIKQLLSSYFAQKATEVMDIV